MIVGLIDYGMGNLRSVRNALEAVGAFVHIVERGNATDAISRVDQAWRSAQPATTSEHPRLQIVGESLVGKPRGVGRGRPRRLTRTARLGAHHRARQRDVALKDLGHTHDATLAADAATCAPLSPKGPSARAQLRGPSPTRMAWLDHGEVLHEA